MAGARQTIAVIIPSEIPIKTHNSVGLELIGQVGKRDPI
jgi:hypothetical protein